MSIGIAAVMGMMAVVGLVLVGAVYFVPSVVAWRRGKRNLRAIFAFNVLFGWSFLGWAGALVWSLMEEADQPVRPRQAAPLRQRAAPPARPADPRWRPAAVAVRHTPPVHQRAADYRYATPRSLGRPTPAAVAQFGRNR